MHRRHLLKSMVAASAALSFPAPFAGAAEARRAMQRVRPSDAAWPTDAQWAGLKAKVHGNLIKPAPLLADCASAPDSAACGTLLKNLHNPYFIGDQPSGTQVSGWLNAWTPAPSAYAVAAQSADDIAAAVDFARVHNLRLVVKGGGHSYQGTSNAPDSLLVWTRAMHAIQLHDAFVAKNCGKVQQPVRAVTIESGAVWMDAYDAVTTRAGRYVQGGGCSTVGVAGLVQSGGFGSFSKNFGTAASSLLEAEIVTADGVVRTVNACSDPELHWALKGGGGGSFGVVTKVTLKTHDLPSRLGGTSATITASSDMAFQRLLAQFMAFYREALCNPHWGESVQIKSDNSLHISMVFQGLDKSEAAQIWKPFYDWVSAAPKDYSLKGPHFGDGPARDWWDAGSRRAKGSNSETFDERPGAPAHHAWWNGDQEQVGAFVHGYDSLWLPASLLEEKDRARLAQALFAASRSFAVQLHFNKGLAGAAADALAASGATATNPQVLTAFALAIIATGGASRYPGYPGMNPDLAAARIDSAKVDAATAALRTVAPGAGSYVSESNYFNRSWQEAYWGPNYPRLLAVKKTYDPAGLFYVHNGVGTEGWSADGFVRA